MKMEMVTGERKHDNLLTEIDDEHRAPKYQNIKDKGHHGEVRLPAGFSQTLFNSNSPIKFISNII